MPDRGTFFAGFSSTLDFLLMQPETSVQKYSTLALALVALIFFLSKLHKWGRAARSGFFLSLGTVAVSTFFVLVVTIWGRQGIDQLGLVEGQEMAALAILLGIAFFAGVAPFTRFCFKSAYFTSVAAWMLTLLLAAGVIYGCHSAWKAAEGAAGKVAAEVQKD